MSRRWMSGFEVSPGSTEFAGSSSLANFSVDTVIVNPGLGTHSGKFTDIGHLESITGLALRQAFLRGYFYMDAAPAPSFSPILGFNNASDSAWAFLCALPDRSIQIRINASAATFVIGTADLPTPIFLATDAWHFLELYVDIDGKLVASRINGVSWSGLRAAPFTQTGDLDRMVIGPALFDPGTTFWIDDCAVNSTLGPANSSWCGTDTIGVIVPVSDGPQIQWIAQNGGSHFAEVDDLVSLGALDDASTYIKETTGTFGAGDEFFVSQLPAGAVISAVLYGMRGGGTGTESRRAAMQAIDADRNVLVGNSALEWNLNGWKTVYPALVGESQWNGTQYMLTADYLNHSTMQVYRADSLAREIRLSALWGSVAAIIPGVVPTVQTPRDKPRILVELGPA